MTGPQKTGRAGAVSRCPHKCLSGRVTDEANAAAPDSIPTTHLRGSRERAVASERTGMQRPGMQRARACMHAYMPSLSALHLAVDGSKPMCQMTFSVGRKWRSVSRALGCTGGRCSPSLTLARRCRRHDHPTLHLAPLAGREWGVWEWRRVLACQSKEPPGSGLVVDRPIRACRAVQAV